MSKVYCIRYHSGIQLMVFNYSIFINILLIYDLIFINYIFIIISFIILVILIKKL